MYGRFREFLSKTFLVSLSSAIALITFAPALHAQDEQAGGEVEELVVTGFRGSLEAAIDVKRDSVGAVDSIHAEDIADFPDLNLAESLQRIPGVAISRSAGEGRQISIRGLGPTFNVVRINGMEALATGGGTDAAGGTNRGRAFDFNTFASELFNNLKVQKSSSADVEEGSLGATVDLQTARPFDYDEFTFAASVQMGYNDFSKEQDPRYSLLLSNTFADDKFGILFSASSSERTVKDDGASTVRWQNSGAGNLSTPATPSNPNPPLLPPSAASFGSVGPGVDYTNVELSYAFRPRIPRYDYYTHETERTGLTASLQFKPWESTVLTLDLLNAKFEGTRQEIFLETAVFSTTGPANIGAVDVIDAQIDGQENITSADETDRVPGTLVYGVFDDVDIRSENRFDKLSTDYDQKTLSLEQEITDALRLQFMIGEAESDHNNPVQTTLLFDATDIDGYSYDFRGRYSRLPLITYGDTDLTDPSIWNLTQIRLRPQTALNTFETTVLNVEFDINDSMTVKGGISTKEYGFVSTEKRRSIGTTGQQESNIPAHIGATLEEEFGMVYNVENNLGPAGTPLQFFLPDIDAFDDQFNLYKNATHFPMGIETALGNNFGVTENVDGIFVQLDFETEIPGLGWPLRGNVGSRTIDTEQESTGYTFNPIALEVETDVVKRDYSDSLPAFNLVAEATEDLLVRLGWGKTMARPGLAQLNPGAPAFSVTPSLRTVTVGNPYLEPFRSDNTDLSVEWYFADEALLSFAYFTKDIDSFVQTMRTTLTDFTNNPLGISDDVAIAVCAGPPVVAGCNVDPGTDWDFAQPQNTPGGDLKGFEISYQQPFTFLPGFLSNFGTQINYTSVDADIQYVNSINRGQGAGPEIVVVATDSLLGLSESSYNLTLYYEDENISARVSGAYRDDYLTTIPGRNGIDDSQSGARLSTANDVEGTDETMNVDMSVTYSLTDSLKLTFEGLNLTEEVDNQYIDSAADRLSYYHHTGRQYLLGLRYSL
jgi:iron complex outermembrane receptor protein